jgi:uncharacterized protein DUF6049
VIGRRAVPRLFGATVAGLAVLLGPVSAAGAAIGPAGAGGALGASGTLNAVAATGGTGGPGTARPVRAGSGLELRLTKVTPAAPGPNDELVVTGTARNLSSTPLKRARISLWLRPEVLADRAAIDDWLAEGTLSSSDEKLPGSVLVPLLGAGKTLRFTILVPPGEAGLFSGSAFGPRAIAVHARAGGRSLATLRSTIVWAPSEITTRTRLSVLVPLTSATPSTHAGEPTAEMAEALSPGGRLQRILTATTREQAIGWAVDPAILASAERLISDGVRRKTDDEALLSAGTSSRGGPTPSTGSGSAAPSTGSAPTGSEGVQLGDDSAATGAQDWLTQFRTELPRRGIFGLPYADPDLTAVLKAPKGLPLLRTADNLGRAATQKALGAALNTTIAWPADGRISPTVTRSLTRTKRAAVILDSETQKPEQQLDYTPSGRSTIRSGRGSLTGLLYDEQLSSLLSTGASGTPAATQTMLAQLAAITMERPDTVRHLLAVTPRTWDPDPNAFQNLMNALGTAPWISLRDLSELREASGPPRQAPTYSTNAAKAELPLGSITGALVLNRGLNAFAPILADPGPARSRQERVVSLLSVAWRQQPERLAGARRKVADDVNGLLGGVQLAVGSKWKILTAQSAPIQLTIVNKTDYEVTVAIRLKPRSGQLSFRDPKTTTVGPNTKVPVLPRARAVASGDVVVEAQLMTVDGIALGPAKTFTVRVRPDWESRGLIVAGSFLGFLLVIGLLRGIRRNRTRVRIPMDAVPDVDELATRRSQSGSDAPDPGDRATPTRTNSESAEVGTAFAAAWTGRAGSDPASGPPPRPILAPPPGQWPVSNTRTGPQALPELTSEPVTGPITFPEPVPDPVPTSAPGPEPDPKAPGGPLRLERVRPLVSPGQERATRRE